MLHCLQSKTSGAAAVFASLTDPNTVDADVVLDEDAEHRKRQMHR